MLYTSTAAGIAYLIRLTNITNYGSYTVFPPHEVTELNIQSYCDYGAITAIAATAGCLVIGGSDGSVGCFRLGSLDSSSPGMVDFVLSSLCRCLSELFFVIVVVECNFQ